MFKFALTLTHLSFVLFSGLWSLARQTDRQTDRQTNLFTRIVETKNVKRNTVNILIRQNNSVRQLVTHL